MYVTSLRRYPVKSMGGEAVDEVEVDARGLVGDRWYAVEDGEGHLASGKNSRRFRRRDRVFDYSAATMAHGVVVTGPAGSWTVGDPNLSRELSRVMGTDVRVPAEDETPHQDAGSVSLVGTATLDWCAERWSVNPDPRRLRVNVVLQTSEPFVEESWVGRRLSLGETRLDVVGRVPRCRMIDIDQDGVTAAGRWLIPLGRERATNLAVYADVASPGTVRVGDALTLH